MTDNDDSSRRRPEDNPFIAFRRFADSQASALLNSVFTLPATIANFNNVHHAREQCLFGRADREKCERLREIESQEAKIRSDGRELYKVGDMQALLNKGEELMKLDRQADDLRKDIVEEARNRNVNGGGALNQADPTDQRGSDNGQHWGWSWSWGFPRPFDEENATVEEDQQQRRGRCRWRSQRFEEAQERLYAAKWDEVQKRLDDELPRYNHDRSRVWSWSWSWPPLADAADREPAVNELPQNITLEFDKIIIDMLAGKTRLRHLPFLDDPYSPIMLEKSEKLGKAGVQWRDAFEDLVRAEQGAPLMPAEQLGQSREMTSNHWMSRFLDPASTVPSAIPKAGDNMELVPWEGEETNDEPSYEYGHDHEDQHDDPPTPKAEQGKFDSAHATELDAYERLLNPASLSREIPTGEKLSVLSTLTTTERTVAPDGTVTTKVVLKKRFADGREESSETVHTQRGQDAEALAQDPWKAIQENQLHPTSKQENPESAENKTDRRRNGWFWSN